MILLALRIAFAATLLAVTLRLAPTAWRALRAPQQKDFDYLLFFGLAASRLILVARGFAYPNPPSSTGEALWTAAGYVTGIALDLGVLVSHRWERQRDA